MVRGSFRFERLELGKTYTIQSLYKNDANHMFIKTTRAGYNLLNLKTGKCLYKQQIYPSKYPNHVGNNETWFFINVKLKKNE